MGCAGRSTLVELLRRFVEHLPYQHAAAGVFPMRFELLLLLGGLRGSGQTILRIRRRRIASEIKQASVRQDVLKHAAARDGFEESLELFGAFPWGHVRNPIGLQPNWLKHAKS